MRKLTGREKILVYIAAVLLLLTGGYYLVKLPSDAKRQETKESLEILRRQNEERENASAHNAALEQEIEKELGVIRENPEDYLPYRTNSRLIPEITEKLTAFDILPESVEIVKVSVLEDGEATASDTERIASGRVESQDPGYRIHEAVLKVTASGTKERLYDFLDWAYEADWIFVTAYSMDEEKANQIGMTITCKMLELNGENLPPELIS